MPLPAFVSRTIHHEALDWATRVSANGGVISTTVLQAVSDFCAAIDRGGLRDRFLRLNLFAGGNLSGALVPLYRASSYGGTVIGNATDTNVNFVSGDFAESGASGGLKGNGTSKYISPGVVPSTSLTFGDVHVAAMVQTAPTGTAFNVLMSSSTASPATNMSLVPWQGSNPATVGYFQDNSFSAAVLAVANPSGLFVGSAISSSDRRAFLNGVQSGATETSSRGPGLPTLATLVFATNESGTVRYYSTARISTYSIGRGMTAAQVLAYHNALASFRAALGRA
jgi:hypothetical protein